MSAKRLFERARSGMFSATRAGARISMATAILTLTLCQGARPAFLDAADTVTAKDGAAENAASTSRADEMLRAFFEREVARIESESRAWIGDGTLDSVRRAESRRELERMLGIDGLDRGSDLRVTNTGTIDRPDLGIVVEKLHFQSLPGLYITANLYRPRALTGRAPGVLYLCGHGQVKIDGVSYGSKAHYQHHPTWLARHGFVALVIDTLQLGEIEGVHHGTYRLDRWWWVARGYTPAGVEAWGSMRALDVLALREDVDPDRLGVTGRSGGGIGSWWLAALDDRVKAVVPVAGLTDLRNHVLDGAIEGHCDCNYLINHGGWDYSRLAALAAPKALLFSNSDKDRIFPLDGVLRLHATLARTYGALGASNRLGLLITEGPHADTQELQVPAFRWLSRWLFEKEPAAVTVAVEKFFDPRELRVLEETPIDERNTSIDETFVPLPAARAVPGSVAELDARRREILAAVASTTFRRAPGFDESRAGADLVEAAGSRGRDVTFCDAFVVSVEDSFRLPLWVLRRSNRPSAVELRVLGEEEWSKVAASIDAIGMGVGHAEAGRRDPARDPAPSAASSDTGLSDASFQSLERLCADLRVSADRAVALLAPRGVGPTRWSGNAQEIEHIRRRFLVLGRTLEETRIHDIRAAIRSLDRRGYSDSELTLDARGLMSPLALWAAIFEPRVAKLSLEAVPPSYSAGVALLGISRITDIPETMSLVYPRRIEIRSSPGPFELAVESARLFPDVEPLRFIAP
jgi:dienelactone hydrolase